ncbi:MAG: hypothetical protein K0R25_107 [Rickettsiaceae bacterium]|nr:hypothetical protein [Rickettsiaceae bacterium]
MMTIRHRFIFPYLLILFIFLPLHNSYSKKPEPVQACEISAEEINYLLEQVKLDNKPAIRAMDECKKSNRSLFARIIDINPSYFEFASPSLRDEEIFISKFAAINPEILKYISPRLASDRFFMFKMSNIYPDAMDYASSKLSNNRDFMIQMIKINPKNFAYSSDRLQDDEEVALLAVEKSGKMLKFASTRLQNNKKLVTEAIKSYSLAINFASEELQKNPQIKKLSTQGNYGFIGELDSFLRKNYGGLTVGPGGSRGYHIVNMAKNYPKKQLIYNPYITKWEQVYKNGVATDEVRLINTSDNEGGWKLDFAKYPELIKSIEDIFITNQVDQNTIDDLNTVSLWEISDKPKVVAFELYLLRKIENNYLKASVSNVTALTAIAKENIGKKGDRKWEISIADAIFDADLKMNVSYQSGHRRYKIWDIYSFEKQDKHPKILFKVEDKDSEYFDLFAKQLNDRYASIYKGGGYAMEINLFDK